MSDISTIYAYFSAIDYKGENVLSSYALPQTPLRLVTDFASDVETKIVWNFGDGTIATTLTAFKSYEFPGQYDINLVVYDCYDNALISTFTKTVTIYDLIPFTFNIGMSGGLYYRPDSFSLYLRPDEISLYLRPETANIELTNGRIHGPWAVRSYYPPYQPVSSVYYSISGSKSRNYWDVVDDKFSHLEPFYTLYQKVSNISLSSYQFDEINSIDFQGVNLYARLGSDNIYPCLSSDDGSFFVGVSGQRDVYFRDDLISGRVNVEFFFDKNNNYLKSKYKSNPQNYINNMKVALSANIVENEDIEGLSVTSNGMDGEYYTVDSFNISPIKFYDTRIPFVVKIKDATRCSIKNFDKIQLSALTLSISASPPSGWSYDIQSLNYTLSSQGSGGAFRGYLSMTGTQVLSNVRINASGTFANNLSSTYTLSGASTYFNVYPRNFYDVYKYNENGDTSQTLKNLRFQETLLDKTVLFDEFLGTVFGDDNSSYNTIGKKTYEKISNFVQNIADVDTVEDDQLFSMIQMMGSTNDKQGNPPENIKRLMNLLSISKNKLFGVGNKFKENFDIRGRTSKSEYGTNLGNRIDNSMYIISAGVPIVALEKFSNEYILLNTYQPLCAAGWNYQLSAYSPTWGWPLVLPTDFTFPQFEKYYSFFEYVEGYDNRTLGGVIDFGNTQTTVLSTSTYRQLYDSYGIADNMLSYTLYDSLSLFTQ